MPRFYVYPVTRGRPAPKPEPGAWVLRPTPVDDDGYRTTWRLGLVLADGGTTEIGTIRILRRGQEAGRTPLDPEFDELGLNYASLGAELDFYVRLREAVPGSALAVLSALGDLATDQARKASFANEPGFLVSLARTSPARTALEEAAGIFRAGTARAPAAVNAELVFHTSTGGDSFDIRFDLDAQPDIPSRINVLIGPNGSGKTKLLSNLALAAFEPDNPASGEGWGRLEGPATFSRVLAFSYSAFDEFDVPAQTKSEREMFARARSGLGYRYFGLRDLSSGAASSRETTRLKTAGQVREEFRRSCEIALDEAPNHLRNAIGRLFREPSFASAGAMPPSQDGSGLQQLLGDTFRRASTGHKFVLLMIVQLAAYLRRDTLVLIDEPEAHLHPPLLASFLTLLRSMLGEAEAHAIIATHSPFIVQETPARYVRIILRHVNRTSVAPPSSETFGADIGTISREVFQLNSRAGEFSEILRELAGRYTLDEIEARFQNGLSSQARALVMAAQARRGA